MITFRKADTGFVGVNNIPRGNWFTYASGEANYACYKDLDGRIYEVTANSIKEIAISDFVAHSRFVLVKPVEFTLQIL